MGTLVIWKKSLAQLIRSTCSQPCLPLRRSRKLQDPEQALISQNRQVVSHPLLETGKVLYTACEPLPGSVLTWHFRWSVHPCEPPLALGRPRSPAEPASTLLLLSPGDKQDTHAQSFKRSRVTSVVSLF